MAFDQAQESQSIQKLSPEVKQQAVEAARPSAQLMDRASSYHSSSAAGGTDHTGNREALLQAGGASGKTQASMSPTDNHKSQTHLQGRSQQRGRGMER